MRIINTLYITIIVVIIIINIIVLVIVIIIYNIMHVFTEICVIKYRIEKRFTLYIIDFFFKEKEKTTTRFGCVIYLN